MLDQTVVLGATRYRMHNGYATQTGGGWNFTIQPSSTLRQRPLPDEVKQSRLRLLSSSTNTRPRSPTFSVACSPRVVRWLYRKVGRPQLKPSRYR